MLTKGFVLVVAAIAIVLSVGASWGVATLASSHRSLAPSSTATGVPGVAGTSGKNGTDGKSGAAGPAGANGSDGAPGARSTAGEQGAVGATGAVGPQGPVGATGASGASAPTFSAISANGDTFRGGPNDAFTFSTHTAPVPAGPALVGFSVGLQNPVGPPYPVTCSLVDSNSPATVFATTASLTPGNVPAFTTYAATQVVNLPISTSLTVECTQTPAGFPILRYQSLSVYAISFAP
jgi:hypothetical protein